MSHVIVSTPRRIPIINFSDDADYDSLHTIMSLIGGFVFQVEVDNSDVLAGQVPNDLYQGIVRMNGDDTITIILNEDTTGGDKEITVHLDDVISFTYL
jgi:translation initiation factor IF-1